MKLRKVVGSFIRIPWIPLLDHLTDACENGATHLGPLSFLVRPCCKPTIALAWFYGLGRVQVVTAAIVERVKVVYYDPREDAIRAWYVKWPNRVILAAGAIAAAYVATFYVYPTLVRPYVSTSWLLAEDDARDRPDHPSYVSTVAKVDWATGEKKEYVLVSKSLLKCAARQSQVAVWVMGTLLRLPTKRFLPLWFASKFVAPLAAGVSEHGGNFALWMSMGTVLSKMFCLYPSEKEKYLGALGTTAALLATSVLLPTTKKIGRTETTLSTSVFLLTELVARYAMFTLKAKKGVLRKMFHMKDKDEDKQKASGSEKPNMLIRAWRYVTYDEETHLSKSWPEFSYPSYYAWLGLVAAWSSLGLALDGV